MRGLRWSIALGIVVTMSSVAYGAFNHCKPGFCDPTGGGGSPPLTNLRITDTGAFRIIDTGDNRAVRP